MNTENEEAKTKPRGSESALTDLVMRDGMRDKICYYSGNIALISSMPCVLFLALVGVDVVFEIKSILGFMFMMISAMWITLCGCVTAVQINKTFGGVR